MRVRRIKSALTATDAVFAAVRFSAFLGALMWIVLHPLSAKEKSFLYWLVSFYFVYGLITYFAVLTYPEKVRKVYLVTLIFDLLSLYMLVPATGDFNSSFAFGFYLLTALYSFYYGLLSGIAVAALSFTLYVLSCLRCLAEIHASDLLLRAVFLGLVALPLGVLSERERRIHKRLVHAERLAAIGRTSSEVAHEIKNPLGSIGLNMELLRDEIKKFSGVDTAEARALIGSIVSEVDKLNNVTDEYLQFVRPPQLKLTRCDINGLLESAILFLSKEAASKNINFVKSFEERLPPALIDERRIRRAALNILRNSFDAMSGGGDIYVATKRAGNNIEISVKDTGVGIPRHHMGRIFEPFFSTKDAGAGLGLSIARGIIEEHNGGIICESEEGKGTVVRISFPISR